MSKEKSISLSKTLRKNQTPWEFKLWQYLRAKRFKLKIVDFCCDEKKLVIELDGGQHGESEIQTRDLTKESYLKKEGYKVLRFWNNEIDQNLEGVLYRINESATSLPTSPHALGRGVI